jgi:hypothetical protein
LSNINIIPHINVAFVQTSPLVSKHRQDATCPVSLSVLLSAWQLEKIEMQNVPAPFLNIIMIKLHTSVEEERPPEGLIRGPLQQKIPVTPAGKNMHC